jgi:hypothetical protein
VDAARRRHSGGSEHEDRFRAKTAEAIDFFTLRGGKPAYMSEG